MNEAQEIKCPYCREIVDPKAIVCRHCQMRLPKRKSFFKKYNNFRLGFLSGIIFTLILLSLIYYHFFREAI